MSEEQNPRDWIGEFQIQSSSDLDFVIGQQVGWPIGMTRSSPPEFRRRVLAAAISHQLGLRSIDYAMKRYVKSDQYEGHKTTIGDSTSDFLREAAEILKDELKQLHTQENLTFGRFGAEITLFKFPEILDLARMLANRGLFLEVLPILRLCLEMTAWSVVSFDTSDEEAVRRLKAHKCVPRIKAIYESAGQVLENHLRTNRERRAEAVSSDFAASAGRSSGFAWARSGSFMMYPTRLLKSWRSWRSRRRYYGSHSSENRNEGSPAV